MIRRYSLAAALLACTILFAPAFASDETGDEKKAEAAELPNCPVMGEKINFAVSVKTDEGPVYLCCAKCKGKYESEPGAFAEQVAEQRKVLADRPKVQVFCPIDENAVDSQFQADHEGQLVHFCSEKCVQEFQANPDKYKSGLANSYTYQTICPVMGEPINPKTRIQLPEGTFVFVCCKKCLRKMASQPEDFSANLESQGMTIDWEAARKAPAGDAVKPG